MFTSQSTGEKYFQGQATYNVGALGQQSIQQQLGQCGLALRPEPSSAVTVSSFGEAAEQASLPVSGDGEAAVQLPCARVKVDEYTGTGDTCGKAFGEGARSCNAQWPSRVVQHGKATWFFYDDDIHAGEGGEAAVNKI